MRIVLINWTFILLTTYSTGYIVLRLLLGCFGIVANPKNNLENVITQEKYIKQLPAPNILILFLGLSFVTAYAQIYSLFAGVAVWANYILIIFSMIVMVANSKCIGKLMTVESKAKGLVYIMLILLFAYGTSRGYMHYDTNLYHAQAIRWIEDYGVVPGLANLQSRFGYNSSEFALNALYSWRWYLGQSLHTTAGFFGLLSSFVLVDISHIWEKRDENGKRIINIRLSDYVRIGLLFYLGIIYSEMISPASDYYAQLMIFDIVIMWLDMNSLGRDDASIYSVKLITEYRALLCILLVFAITIKLSIGVLVFLALIPACEWMRSKRYKNIISCLVAGLVIALPYFIRNYIISGWILYPSTILRIGSPDWQIPKGEAQYDAKEISMWGRGVTSAKEWSNVTATNWIGKWFTNLKMLEKAWVIFTIIAVIIGVALVVKSIVLLFNKKKSGEEVNIDSELCVICLLMLGTIFWFLSAPLIRYGYAYLIIMPLIILGYLLETVVSDRNSGIKNGIFILLAAGVVILKGKGLLTDILRTYEQDYYIMQQDYIDGDAYSYEVDGETFYVATDAGQIGYYKFPATVEEKNNFTLRGNSLSDGFSHR